MREGGHGTRSAGAAALGAACISPMAILVTLADAGPVPTAFYRCVLALPVLAVLGLDRAAPPRAAPVGPARLARCWRACCWPWTWCCSTTPSPTSGPGWPPSSAACTCRSSRGWPGSAARAPGPALPAHAAGGAARRGAGIGAGRGRRHRRAPRGRARLRDRGQPRLRGLPADPAAVGGPDPARAPGQVFDATAGAAVGTVLLGLAFGGLRLAVSWSALGLAAAPGRRWCRPSAGC